ncbi:TIGR04222 domain-containing membrane protein [Streptomyces sp. NPDC018031]|uniref:TIGR04222 domain-containing membrane protein n=1 Tax=Streptomyces sp. NPDC018031 TaxID=3365033 RepID=UPI003791D575
MVWIAMLAAGYGLTAVTAVWFRWAHRRLVRAPVVPRPAPVELTLHEVAFLSRGRRGAAETVLASMLLAGRLTVRDRVLTVLDPVPRDRVEADVIDAFGTAPCRKPWKRLDRLTGGRGITAVGDRLADLGLVGRVTLHHRVARADEFLFSALALSCLTGVVSVYVAAGQGDNPLVPLAATAVLWGAGVLAMRPGGPWGAANTEAGKEVLAALDAGSRPWPPVTRDDLSEAQALLLREVARDGRLRGELAPLSAALSRPASPTGTMPNNDPPGLGGAI